MGPTSLKKTLVLNGSSIGKKERTWISISKVVDELFCTLKLLQLLYEAFDSRLFEACGGRSCREFLLSVENMPVEFV